MPTGTRILFAALAACALGAVPAIAQDHQSNTKITITDDGKKRHIVVEKDGKVVRDEWTTSEPGKGYTILRPGKDGQFRLEKGDGNIVITRDGKSNTVIAGSSGAILQPGRGPQYRLEKGQHGVTIVSDGKSKTITVPGAAATVHVSKDGKYRLDHAGPGSRAIVGSKDGRFFVAPDVAVRSQAVKGQDINKLLNSLTFDPREKMHDRGYLTLDDLSPQQRRLFSVPKGDNWTVSYEINGNKVTIRSR
jgi:hypothetical protein